MVATKHTLNSHTQKQVVCDVDKAEKEQKRTHLKSHTKIDDFTIRFIKSQTSTQTLIAQPTLQRSSENISEIIITKQMLNAFIALHKDYGVEKPGWLRRKFLINRLRRSYLNHLLLDAGCTNCSGNISSDWSGQLHSAWHLINRSSLCI